ncbi:TPA: hypothetical protein ACRTTK_003081 [Aeromonas hydrophila]
MLDSPKAQAVYRALQSSGAFNSSAGDKASRAISKSTDLQGQLGVLATLPKEGLPPGGGLPTIVPKELKAAAAKLDKYRSMMGGATTISEGLSNAIGQRMENVTGNMARMSAASAVAQKMGNVPDGCGPLGAAFSVLTSEGRTDLLNTLMDSLDAPLNKLKEIFAQGLALNASSLPAPLKAALDAAMGTCDAIMVKVNQATSAIKELVDEAQSMWNALDQAFTNAVNASILMSVFGNGCMRSVIDSVAPPAVSDVLNSFS